MKIKARDVIAILAFIFGFAVVTWDMPERPAKSAETVHAGFMQMFGVRR